MSISNKTAPKKPKGTQKAGGDAVYTQADFIKICDILSSSKITLRDACASKPHFMNEVTFWRMLSANKKNKLLYQQAKFNQTEVKVDYLDAMMEEHQSMYTDAQGILRVDAAVLRAKIDVIKWSVAVNNTHKFHLKNTLESSIAQVAEDTAKLVAELNEKNKKEY